MTNTNSDRGLYLVPEPDDFFDQDASVDQAATARVAHDDRSDVALVADAEVDHVDPGHYGGPVDSDPIVPRTLYATVTSRSQEPREPIVPAWLRNGDQRVAFVKETWRYSWYLVGFHGLRMLTLKYPAKVALWAPVGVFRLASRQVRWWWVSEQYAVRQHAASKNDGEMWMKLHGEAKKTRAGRGLWLLGEVAGVSTGALVLALVAPLVVQVPVLAVLLLVLAQAGRPVGKPITDRVHTGPRFLRLRADMVRTALCSLGIPGIKDPSSLQFPQDIQRDGPGWLARVNLPAGVEAVKVLESRGALSSALRLPVDQVWPSAGPAHAGQVDLWVGYMPASQMGPPRWSLLAPDARTSVFREHEFASNQRQEPVKTVLFERNFLIGGAPGSGKSFGARTLATIAMLDPTCELKIAEYKGTADFGDMAHLCSTYVCGIDNHSLEQGRDIIAWGHAEAERRGARIKKFREQGLAPEGKVTPELAAMPGSGLHPVLILIDEAHELFLHDKKIGEDAEKLIKRGRALGIIIVLSTQIPDSKSLPSNITRCVTVRWCLAVVGQMENDMILGTGAYKRGLTSTVYRPGVDAGWGVAIGLAADGPVRSFYPNVAETKALVARATALRGGVVGSTDEAPRERRDICADVLKVFARTGHKRLHREPLLAFLVEFWPEAYAGWTPDMLGDAMRAAGVPVGDVKVLGTTRKGVKVEAVHAAIQARQITTGER